MTFANWLARLECGAHGAVVREQEIPPQELQALRQAGLIDYAGLDTYSDCADCEMGTGCPVERLGGTEEAPEYVAHCPRGEYLVYREVDLRRWRMAMPTVAGVLAERLDHRLGVETLVPGRLWAIGRLATRVPMFLARGVTGLDAASAFAPLHERLKLGKALVLVPGPLPDAGMLPRQAVPVPLGDVLSIDCATLRVDIAYLGDLARQLAGDGTVATVPPIAVPPGFTWPQITVECISDEDVRIWTVGEPVVKSFADLGMANVRDGRPTRLWYLLQEFAGHEGVYDLSHPSGLYPPKSVPGACRHAQPTAFSPKLGSELSDLREHLRRLFPGVAGDPIARYDKAVHAYRTMVLLRWEPGYRQRKTVARR